MRTMAKKKTKRRFRDMDYDEFIAVLKDEQEERKRRSIERKGYRVERKKKEEKK